jgi:uncharacterized protein (TIGR02391 family)
MAARLKAFERIVRRAQGYTEARDNTAENIHPFDERNIHERISDVSLGLFDNGHYSQATFEAYKFVDKTIQDVASSSESGFKLMMSALGGSDPAVKLNPNETTTEQDEQKGFQFLFAGSILAIRNPRGHEYAVQDSAEKCLDHLGLASMLVRRIEEAGYSIT